MSTVNVKNVSPKIIGLGTLRLEPNETGALPVGFGTDHPTVVFLLGRGWLTQVTEGGIHIPPGAKIDDPPKVDDPDPGAEADANDDDEATALAENIAALDGKEIEQLRELATALGVTFGANAGADLLRQRITERYQAIAGGQG